MAIGVAVAGVALVLFAIAPGARAQTPVTVPSNASFVVVGTVVDRDGHPLSGADVALVQRDSAVRRMRSDSAGQFVADGLRTDTATFRLRRFGFEPKTVSVRVTSSDRVAKVVLTLEAAVASLDPVRVEDAPGSEMPSSRLAGFYERSRTNSFGRYITEAKLKELRPHYPSEALRGVPGAMLKHSLRGVGNIVRFRQCGVPGVGASIERNGPLVWVDGVRAKGAELDDVASGEDIAGIEIYTGLAGIPAQFFDRTATCGTILVWTKTK